MTVTSKQEAWNKVNEIFPADYEQDLGNRLEVNLDSSRQPAVNIWIEEPVQEPTTSDEDIKAGVEFMHAAKALGQRIWRRWMLRQAPLLN